MDEKITMAHGAGGQASHELMERIFGKCFHNAVLDTLEDAAVLDISGKVAYSTDSFVVTPLFFPGGNIGKLAVCGTVNDLLMMGAEPKYLSCGFIIEEGLPVETLREVVSSMAEQAKEAGVLIACGDTKVVDGKGGLYINTSGIGLIPEGRAARASAMREGNAVLLSGNLGDHQAAIYSARMGIENNIVSDCSCLSDITGALYEAGVTPHAMRDVTRGGLATILNELASSSACRVTVTEEAVPVSEAVRGFSDILGLDPLYMANEGKLVAVVPAAQEKKALSVMRKTAHGVHAALIGHVEKGSGVVLKTRLGGTRVLDVLYGEGLPRIC